MGAQGRLKSSCASTQSDKSLCCQHEQTLESLAIRQAPSEDSDQTARMLEGVSSVANFITAYEESE